MSASHTIKLLAETCAASSGGRPWAFPSPLRILGACVSLCQWSSLASVADYSANASAWKSCAVARQFETRLCCSFSTFDTFCSCPWDLCKVICNINCNIGFDDPRGREQKRERETPHWSIQPALAHEDASWWEALAMSRMAAKQWQTAFWSLCHTTCH